MAYVITEKGWRTVNDSYSEADLAAGERLVFSLPRELLDSISEAQSRAEWKRDRAAAVQKIVVTVGGMNFDGDEISQSRMARAIIGLQNQPEGSTVQWVLADNSVVAADFSTLIDALTLSGLRQTELWVK